MPSGAPQNIIYSKNYYIHSNHYQMSFASISCPQILGASYARSIIHHRRVYWGWAQG